MEAETDCTIYLVDTWTTQSLSQFFVTRGFRDKKLLPSLKSRRLGACRITAPRTIFLDPHIRIPEGVEQKSAD